FTADKLKCIPENIGKYKAMDIGQLRFLDSFQHMGMGLDKLVEWLGGKLKKFPLTVKHFTKKGYILEVDLEVPVHLHDFFANYPLASEKQIVSEDWLSLYNERLVYNKEVGSEKYMSGENALKFRQSLWMKEYIEENICKCKIAKVNEDEFG
ncbi:32039_t:CDS:2, partial [Racocetra persica]